MSRKEKTRMWVHPEYAKKLKIQAARESTSILDLTRKLSKDEFEPMERFEDKPKKNGRWSNDFRF